MSTHLQECGEEGREDKEKKSNFSAPPATWKSLVPSQPQASTDHLPEGRSYEQQGTLQADADISCQNSSISRLDYGRTKNLGVRSAEIQMNTNSVAEQRPSLKLG